MKTLNKVNSVLKNNINVQCYHIDSNLKNLSEKLVVPSSKKREWMDQPDLSYSYYCGPLVAANQLGYNIIYQNETEVIWNGGTEYSDIKINHVKQGEHFCTCDVHFEIDILTFNFPLLFQTPPGWGLLVSGPANNPIEGLYPLEGLVETNWLPFTFTMNFKIMEKNKLIKIKQYTPICRVLPYPLNLNEKTTLSFFDLQDNKKLALDYNAWGEARDKFNEKGTPEPLSNRQFFYRDGKDPNGNAIANGMHKLDYKFDYEKNSSKCPFLSKIFKFKNK